MKKLNVLTRMLLLVALLVGSTSVWAIDVTATLTGSAWTTRASSTSYVVYNDPIYDDKGNGYIGRWCHANPSKKPYYYMIQIKAYESVTDGSARLVLPKYDGKIKTITLSVTSSSGTEKEQSGKEAKNKVLIAQGTTYSKKEADDNTILTVDHSTDETKSFEMVFDFTTLDTDYNGENLYICSASGSLRIWEMVVVYEANSVSASFAANKEWITYCSPYALDFSSTISGLEGAYTISSHTSGATTLTASKMTGTVKAGTGLLLHVASTSEEAQAVSIPVVASGTEQTGNMLKGVYVATTVAPTESGNTNLGLKNGTFVPYSASGTIAARKAYLQIPTAEMPETGDAKLTIIFDNEPSDETTAIAGVEVKKGAGVVYNLAGQRVTNPTKGLYIINGKKVIIK